MDSYEVPFHIVRDYMGKHKTATSVEIANLCFDSDTRSKNQRVTQLMEYAYRRGFRTCYDEGIYTLLEQPDVKPTKPVRGRTGSLLMYTQTNGIGGIHASRDS